MQLRADRASDDRGVTFTENFAHASTWGIASRGFTATHGWPLPLHTLVAGIMGSTAHGTYVPHDDPQHIDDIDVMVICQPPRRLQYGLATFDNWCPPVGTLGEVDIVVYSVRKFTTLLIKGNPNVVGLLYLSEHNIAFSATDWLFWQNHRDLFLSQRVYHSFVGYAMGQLSKLGKPNTRGWMGAQRKELFTKYGYDCKNAAHCIRLLHMGLELMEEGTLHVDRTGRDAELLMEVKQGRWTLGQVEREAQRGMERMNAALAGTSLPTAPDATRIEELMLNTMEAFW